MKAKNQKQVNEIISFTKTMVDFCAKREDKTLAERIESVERWHKTGTTGLLSLLTFAFINVDQYEAAKKIEFDYYFDVIYPLEEQQRKESKSVPVADDDGLVTWYPTGV